MVVGGGDVVREVQRVVVHRRRVYQRVGCRSNGVVHREVARGARGERSTSGRGGRSLDVTEHVVGERVENQVRAVVRAGVVDRERVRHRLPRRRRRRPALVQRHRRLEQVRRVVVGLRHAHIAAARREHVGCRHRIDVRVRGPTRDRMVDAEAARRARRDRVAASGDGIGRQVPQLVVADAEQRQRAAVGVGDRERVGHLVADLRQRVTGLVDRERAAHDVQ